MFQQPYLKFKRAIFLLCLMVLGVSINFVQAQKVGVVLSGGGAGGISHIGVLKALEDNNIPIDFIAGTSIGALIGGMYAAGYTPEQIEIIVLSNQFMDWANGQINTEFQYYYKNKPFDASWINFKFSIDTLLETNLPTSYINPFPIDLGVLEVFARSNATSNGDFDSLFVPFRCVGSNITNRELTIFKEGDLATSVRASMSYPFFLSPVEIDGQLYFDGGIYNNFPTDLMCKEFNPDFIIGSNSSSNFPKPKADNVLSQIKYMLSQNTNYEINCNDGIIIRPSAEVNVFDFSQNKLIIDSAYKETLLLIDSIKGEIARTVDNEYLNSKRKDFKGELPKIIIDELELTGVNKAQQKYIRKELKIKSDTIGLDRVKPRLHSLNADEKIRSIYPTAYHNDSSGYYKLNLKIDQEKKFFLSFGGNLSNKPINQGFIGLQYNFLGRTAISLYGNGYFGQFYGSALGGGRIDLLFPTPFYIKSNFVSNRWNYFENEDLIVESDEPIYLISRENYAEVGLGIPVGTRGKLEAMGIGGRNKFEYYQDNRFTQFDTTDLTKFNTTSTSLTYDRNSMNRKQYPSEGSQLILKAKYTHGKEVTEPGSTSGDKTIVDIQRFWYSFRLMYDKYYIRNHKLKIGSLVEATYSNQPLFGNYVSSLLIAPAFEPIPELKTLFQERYRSYNYFGGGMKFIYSFTSRVDLRIEGYIYQPYQEILQTSDQKAELGKKFDAQYFIGSATTVYHSPLGPLALSLNYYNVNVDKLSVLVHFGYMIFNKKMLH